MGWTLDFFRALEEIGKVRLWLLRFVIGRYAFREMVGMFEDLKKRGWWIEHYGYDLRGVDYHKDNARLEFISCAKS